MPTLELLSVVVRLAAGCWLLWRVATPDRDGERRTCAVVIPARDEAANLPGILDSVLPQLRADDELVVVDDGSTDETAGVAAARGARVLPVAAPPIGTNGKSAACWAGAAATIAPALVFLDADVTLAPGALDRLLATHAHAGGLLSVQPYHRTRRPYERLSALFNVVAMMGTGAFTPWRGRANRATAAFGPVLVTARDRYVALGGHGAVASAVLDDVALAARYAAAGEPVTCLGGRGVASFRMYPDGLGQLIEGWTKNVASGARTSHPFVVALVVAWLSAAIQAAWWLGRLLATGDGPGRGATFTLLAYGLVAAQLVWMLRRIGSFGTTTALLYPVPLLAFVVIFARSFALTALGRRVRWRGRQLSTRSGR